MAAARWSVSLVVAAMMEQEAAHANQTADRDDGHGDGGGETESETASPSVVHAIPIECE